MKINASRTLIAACLVLALSQVTFGYSVLTHQALTDAAWEGGLKPLLLKRFPNASAEQLREARAHMYGGAIIQDLGYYPFGNKFFSDLAHYVRSGDFVEAMIEDAKDLNEYAFALGALQHHAADSNGHPIAVNRSVPLLYPKLRREFGEVVTYENGPTAHLRTEFSFDVCQVAKGRYTTEAYHDFIGFKVSKELLSRAFVKTYGIELKSQFTDLDLALNTYKYAVSTLIPEMTKVAWESKKDDIEKLTPGITREKFVYNLSQAEYEKEWGNEYQRPGTLAKVLSFFLRVMPKVGPLKVLSFKPVTPEVEELFIVSFKASLERFRGYLVGVESRQLELPNENYDIGKITKAGEYRMADEAYAKLVEKLAEEKFQRITPELRENILAFYQDLNMNTLSHSRKDREDWQKTVQTVGQLRVTQQSFR